MTTRKTARNPRPCVICGTPFYPIYYTKGGLSPRKTCSNECRIKLYSQQRQEWKPEEVELLKDYAESMPTLQLIRVFNQLNKENGNPHRTAHSIKLKIHDLGLSLRPQYNLLSCNALARVLGVSVDAVRYWTTIGLAYSRQRDVPRSPRFISAANLRKFARERPELFGGLNSVDLYIALESESLVEFITTNYPNRNRGLTPPKRVRCIETGRIYSSYMEAAKAHYVTRSGIFKAVKFGRKANGYHFEKVDE